MIIVTGASNNHYKTLIQFLLSLLKNKDNSVETIIVYNLGIDLYKWESIKERFKDAFIYKIFQYDKYPHWYNININAGEYAWKPAIIYETYLEYNNKVIVWMDSGTLIHNIHNFENIIKEECIHSVLTSGNIKKWTHPTTIRLLNTEDDTLINRNASCIGINTNISWVKDFLVEFYTLSCNKNYIAPEGSSRVNHRQDQSIFTILYYKYKKIYNFKETPTYKQFGNNIFYSIQNDID